MTDPAKRCFLLLQGPHGPFFGQLGKALRATGAMVWRVGFNQGDRMFWPDPANYIGYRGSTADWPETCRAILRERGVTDLVVYGDTRPLHAQAIAAARAAGVIVHVFEEGYLRPYWVSYERGGANGHSRLMTMGVAQMRAALPTPAETPPEAPAHWGEMRQHILYGALYHFFVLALNRGYPAFRPHRDLTVAQEFRLYLRRLALMPLHTVHRWLASARIRRGGFRFHLVLMQLEHDASFRAHSPFATMAEFIELCLSGFAEGAPADHHLVFKAHPLEDGRAPLRRTIARRAQAHGLAGRVHFVRGGKLAGLLARADSAVTVNSTAAQQALWRGLPVRAFGRAVYTKPEFVSDQPLPAFFAALPRPDAAAYRAYRAYLLATSQVAGGFYSARGRRRLLRRLPALMLAPTDPYDALTPSEATAHHSSRTP